MRTHDEDIGARISSPLSIGVALTLLTKMNYSDQVKGVALQQKMVAVENASFHTSWARRQFKKNFYRWSIRCLEQTRASQSEVVAVQLAFLSTLEKIFKEQTLQDNPKSPSLALQLEPEAMIVTVLGTRCTHLFRTFMKLDRSLAQIYVALLSQKISRDEFDNITNQVQQAFNSLRDALDDVLSRPKPRCAEA